MISMITKEGHQNIRQCVTFEQSPKWSPPFNNFAYAPVTGMAVGVA